MKYRIIRQGHKVYVQKYILEFTYGGSYRQYWEFVCNWGFGFKRDFVTVACAEKYIESCLNDCPDYEVVKVYG